MKLTNTIILPEKFYVIVTAWQRPPSNLRRGLCMTFPEIEPSEMMTVPEVVKAIDSHDAVDVAAVLLIERGRVSDASEDIAKAWWNENYTKLEPDECGKPTGVPYLVERCCDAEITNWTGEYLDLQRARAG